MGRRFLALTAILFAIVVISSWLYFCKPPEKSGVKFGAVDVTAFQWSGQIEGETVSMRTESSGSVRGMYVPSFSRYSLAVGLVEAAKKLGGTPLLPTLLPDGMTCSDVYIGPVVDICFSYDKTKGPSSSDIVIEISRPAGIPTLEEQNHAVSNLTGLRLIQTGDIWVTISDTYYHDPGTGVSWAPAYFFHDSFYYIMNAKYPLTNQDLTTIIGSMRTPT